MDQTRLFKCQTFKQSNIQTFQHSNNPPCKHSNIPRFKHSNIQTRSSQQGRARAFRVGRSRQPGRAGAQEDGRAGMLLLSYMQALSRSTFRGIYVRGSTSHIRISIEQHEQENRSSLFETFMQVGQDWAQVNAHVARSIEVKSEEKIVYEQVIYVCPMNIRMNVSSMRLCSCRCPSTLLRGVN